MKEAVWRVGAAQAYFAAFHLAARLLARCGFRVPDADRAHGYVWLRLSNCGHPDLERAGQDLRSLRGARNRAHYDLSIPFPQAQARDAVLTALELAGLFDDASAMPDVLVRMTAAVRAYERDVLRDETWRG